MRLKFSIAVVAVWLGALVISHAQNTNATLVNSWLQKQSSAFDRWNIGGEIRTRYEVKDNSGLFPDATPDRDFIRRGKDNDDAAFFTREKVHVGYTRDWFQFYAEGRDSTSTGDDRNPNPFADRFDLHQVFVSIGNPKEFPLTLKVGRQQLSYGDERLVEIADWTMLERVFDAAKLRFENEKFWVDAFASHPVIVNDGSFNEGNTHDLFSGVYASTRSLIPIQDTELYFLGHDVSGASARITNSSGTGPTARDIYTIGARVKSLPGKLWGWDYGAEVAGQTGSYNQAGKRLDQQAWMADFMGGYTWTNVYGKPRLGFDFTYGSGDSNSKDGKHETFDLLFGAAHKFYGLMDVTGLRNTQNPSVNFTIKPVKKVTVRADYLLFWLADGHDLSYAEIGKGRTLNGYGINPQFSSYVGSEFDLTVSYVPTRWWSLQASYGHFFVGDYVKSSVGQIAANGGAVDSDWICVQSTFSF